MLALVLHLLTATAEAGVSKLDPASEARLAAGEILLLDRTSARPAGIAVEGVADVKTTAAALWTALLDFKARLAANSSVKSFDYYKASTATEQWGAWEVTRFGMTVVYHNHYRIDRAGGTLRHQIDPAEHNDLLYSQGVYSLGPSPNNPAWMRLSYAVDTEFGAAIPGFIKSWLAGQGVRDYLTELVSRAERTQ